MNDARRTAAFAEFEKQGESSVRVAINTKEFKLTPLKHEFAVEWCRLKDEARTHSIQKENSAHAGSAARYAMWTVVIAILGLIVNERDALLALIFPH